ncbi:MAG: hypothetical protein K1X29_11600 [Bdellovibrionales bacterium]|nr:hypothetical protein [Bdellovibrionales bacterium]
MNLESTHNEFFEKIKHNLVKFSTSEQSTTQSCEKLLDECLNGKIPATTTFAFIFLQNILMSIGSKSLADLKTTIEFLIKKVMKSKLVQIKIRQRMIQKLYSFETFVKLMVLKSEKTIEKTSQVFTANAESLIAT